MQESLVDRIVFLARFFSAPDRDFLEEVLAGNTPLGPVSPPRHPESLDAVERLAHEMTSLFVNDPARRPVHPLAREHLSASVDRTEWIERLSDAYAERGLVVTGYPPDHLRVQLEFLIRRLLDGDPVGALVFHSRFIHVWTTRFVERILERDPSEAVLRAAWMLVGLGTDIGRERGPCTHVDQTQ